MTTTPEPLDELLSYLKHSRGFDFTDYKRGTLERRIEKRMDAVGTDSYGAYLDYLEVHPDEFPQLFDAILINVTGFFRDPAAWQFVSDTVIPAIDQAKRGDGQIRVWTAGCASGEEAYTAAIAFAEILGEDALENRIKVYATDADEDALATARQGIYSAKDLEPVGDDLRKKYFEEVGSRFAFRRDLRRSVIFGRHDLVQDAPISRLDLLICRNTLMYFNSDLQTRILRNFHFALNDDGFLFLGKAETLLGRVESWGPVDLRHRVFSKVPRSPMRERMLGLPVDDPTGRTVSRAVLLRDAAIDAAPIAQVLVDVDGTLLIANEQARALFSIAPTDIGRPIQDLEISYRPVELRSRIESAYGERRAVGISDIERKLPNGELQTLDVTISPMFDGEGGPLGVTIVFADVTQYRRLRQDLERSNHDLETAYEELQSTNEELETTNEELQSTVEELETTNEELQSANEELETTNEELQSTNSEIAAINDEMRQRTGSLNQMVSLADGIISSLHVAVIVVDDEGRIRSWNDRAADMWGLRSEEVEQLPFLELDIGMPLGEVRTLLDECREGRSCQVTVPARNRRGRDISVRVSCNPLVADGEMRRGVVVVMEELADD